MVNYKCTCCLYVGGRNDFNAGKSILRAIGMGGPWKSSFFGRRKSRLFWALHCKDKIQKFRDKYSQKRNIGVSVPISTFMRLWATYIFPRSVCLLCWRKYLYRSWDYINRSQTHECWNWGWGSAIPRKGIHKWDFLCSVKWQQAKPTPSKRPK